MIILSMYICYFMQKYIMIYAINKIKINTSEKMFYNLKCTNVHNYLKKHFCFFISNGTNIITDFIFIMKYSK